MVSILENQKLRYFFCTFILVFLETAIMCFSRDKLNDLHLTKFTNDNTCKMKLILSNLKQNIILYLCLFCCLFSFKDVKASHAMAVDITYECVGLNQYYFCVNFYRDCNGIPAPNDVTLSLIQLHVTNHLHKLWL